MKNTVFSLPALAAAIAGTVVLVLAGNAHAQTAKAGPQVARGEYLVTTSGCHDCHTPLKMGAKGPEPDMTRALSGHPEGMALPPAPRLPEGPWIASIAANMSVGTAGSDQLAALFGTFSLSLSGYIAIVAQMALMALVTAMASRRTVNRSLEFVE